MVEGRGAVQKLPERQRSGFDPCSPCALASSCFFFCLLLFLLLLLLLLPLRWVHRRVEERMEVRKQRQAGATDSKLVNTHKNDEGKP